MVAAILASTISAAAAPQRGVAAESDVALARDYVLATCIIDRYPDTPIAREAGVMAAGLVEKGGIAGDAYPRLADYARRNAPPPEQSRSGVQMLLASCLALYNGRTVRQDISKILARR